MRRRAFLAAAGGSLAGYLVGCTRPAGDPVDPDAAPSGDAATTPPPDAGTTADACTATVTLYDTHAQALYFDGSLGPRTGIITVDMIAAGAAVDFVFWHGHGGVSHRFRLEPSHLAALKRKERVTLTTTTVEGHSHMLFVDPIDPQYRVAGAPPRTIANC